MTTYTSSNTQPGTKVIHEGEHISYVESVNTDTNTLIVFHFPFSPSTHAEELLTYERKFTTIEVLPDAEIPNLFICHGEIV